MNSHIGKYFKKHPYRPQEDRAREIKQVSHILNNALRNNTTLEENNRLVSNRDIVKKIASIIANQNNVFFDLGIRYSLQQRKSINEQVHIINIANKAFLPHTNRNNPIAAQETIMNAQRKIIAVQLEKMGQFFSDNDEKKYDEKKEQSYTQDPAITNEKRYVIPEHIGPGYVYTKLNALLE